MAALAEALSAERLRTLVRSGADAKALQAALDTAVTDSINELFELALSRLRRSDCAGTPARDHAGACLLTCMASIFKALHRKMRAEVLDNCAGGKAPRSAATDEFVAGRTSFVTYFSEMLGDARHGPVRHVVTGAESRISAHKHSPLTPRKDPETGKYEHLDDVIDRQLLARGERAGSDPETDLAAGIRRSALFNALQQLE